MSNFKNRWNAIQDDETTDPSLVDTMWGNIDQRVNRYQRSKRVKQVSLLVAPIILLIGWYFIGADHLLGRRPQIYTTANETKEVLLEDGSRITMEPHSTLTVKGGFNKTDRSIEFIGKGKFKIHSDKTRPFRVDAHSFQVEVLGTTFILDQKDQKELVQLIEGKVKVTKSGRITILHPDEIWTIGGQGQDLKYVAASVERNFDFDNMDFQSAIELLEKTYNVQIDFPEHLSRQVVSGSFTGNLNDVLTIVSFPFQLKITKISNKKYELK